MVNRGGVGAGFARVKAPLVLVLLAAAGAILFARDASQFQVSRPSLGKTVSVQNALSQLPMGFEPNKGQAGSEIKFLARNSGYSLFLTPNTAVLSLTSKQPAAIEMRLAGANQDAKLAGSERLSARSNYFIGNDPSRWRTNIPQFARVNYRQVYPGIDLAFYGNQGRLEYDFDVAPGADPKQIELDFKGAQDVSITSGGDLALKVGSRELRFQAPRIYQTTDAGTQPVSGSFVLLSKSTAGFAIGDYDSSRALVIDPVLAFSTYLGGAGDESCTSISGAPAGFVAHCPSIAVDSASRIYLAGATTSSGTFSGVTVPAANGGEDMFLTRLSASGAGYAVDYVDYVGGSGTEYPGGLSVDGAFNVYIAGTTSSGDFPVTSSAFQSGPPAANKHAFVSKFDSTGSANLYSTYLAGSGVDTVSGLAVDSLGRAYVIGITASADFPVTAGALQSTSLAPASNQFFFSKVDPSSSGTNSLAYSTYIGGSAPSNGTVTGGAVAVDTSFNVYLAGGTTFTDMPIVNAYKATQQGGFDVWAARLNAPTNNTQQYTPLYETYFGGTGDDIAYGVTADTANLYVTGSTKSTGLTSPSGATAFQTCLDQPPPNPGSCNTGLTASDAFIAKFGIPTTTGTTSGSVPLSFFTYLGGSSNDAGTAVVIDSTQNARVTGWTQSGDFPNSAAISGSSSGATDAFMSRIVTTGTSTTNTSASSILGGSGGKDVGTSIAIDTGLNVYVAGETASGNFPKANPVSASLASPADAFVTKLGPITTGLTFVCSGTSCPGSNPTVSPSPVGIGSQVKFTYSIYNTGDPVPGVVFTDTLTNSTYVSATANQGLSCQNTGNSAVCNLGTVPTSAVSSTGVLTPLTVTVTVCASGGLTCANTAASTPGVLPPVPPAVTNSATLSGANFPTLASSPATAIVNDFAVDVTPKTQTVTAGVPATYSVKVSPTGAGFPESVSLSCGSGLPSGGSCSFTNAPIPNMSNGPQSRALQITTTARVTTTSSRFVPGGSLNALWLPILGTGLAGAGISRKRRWLLGLFAATLAGFALLQAGCGGGSKSTTTTTGTPAGTYTITVNATSGATRTTTVQLTVQ